MKNTFLGLLTLLIVSACQQAGSRPWTDFKKCASNSCVPEALAVKDAFLKQPHALLNEFTQTYQNGEDHVVGWLYLLRDSVLLNPAAGSVETRQALQQALLNAAKPFEKDPKMGEMAQSVLSELEPLNIVAGTVQLDASALAGTYAYDKGEEGNGELRVTPTTANQFTFHLELVGGPPNHYLGSLDGSATLEPNNEATFTLNEYGGTCRLRFRWSNAGNTVEMETLEGTSPECGFGYNVVADGTYQRVPSNNASPQR
jgi:hypothetical protein